MSYVHTQRKIQTGQNLNLDAPVGFAVYHTAAAAPLFVALVDLVAFEDLDEFAVFGIFEAERVFEDHGVAFVYQALAVVLFAVVVVVLAVVVVVMLKEGP